MAGRSASGSHRQSPIDAVIGTRRNEQGEEIPVTVADRIVAALRAGNFLETAVATVDVHRDTVKGWLRAGARIRIEHGGTVDDSKLNSHERRCVAFSMAVQEAEAAWLVDTNTNHERLARGGLPQVVETVETLPDGGVKTSVRTTHTLPDARVLEWRMKHRFPDLYSDRIEVSGPGGGPIELSTEERASALVVLAAQFREQAALEPQEADPVDVEVVEERPARRRRKPPATDRSALVSESREEGTANGSGAAV